MNTDSGTLLEDEVRAKLRQRHIDPQQQEADLRELIERTVQEYEQRALMGAVPALADASSTVKSLHDLFAGAGALQPFLDDPDVEEIWINGPSQAGKLLLHQRVVTRHFWRLTSADALEISHRTT